MHCAYVGIYIISARDIFAPCANTQHATQMQNIQIQLGDNGYTCTLHKWCFIIVFAHKFSIYIYSAPNCTRYTKKISTHAHESTQNIDTESSLTIPPLLPHLKTDGWRQGIRFNCFSLPISISLSIRQGASSLTPNLIPETYLLRFQVERCDTISSTGTSGFSTFCLPASSPQGEGCGSYKSWRPRMGFLAVPFLCQKIYTEDPNSSPSVWDLQIYSYCLEAVIAQETIGF